jgi:thioredoxin reductase
MAGHVVVTGEPAAAATAALTLSDCGCSVTLVIRETGRAALPAPMRRLVAQRANIRVRRGTEVAVADGIDQVEVVVLRHLSSGRIDACNASALFVVTPEER